MKKTVVLLSLVSMLAMMAFASTASAKHGFNKLARAECRVERATEPWEFKAQFGGTGKGAMKRCIRYEKRSARADCREERYEEPQEFRIEYGGTGKKAMRRCIRDEIR